MQQQNIAFLTAVSVKIYLFPLKFTKRLPGLKNYTYTDQLNLLGLHSLEWRRVYTDLIWCYKIVFGLVDLNCDEFFSAHVFHRPGAVLAQKF